MKILRWLLSHSFLILLIVVVIYGYMFWGNLLGKETPAGKAIAYLSEEFDVVDDFVNAVRAKQARLNGDKTSDSSQVAVHDAAGDDGQNVAGQDYQTAQTQESVTEVVIVEERTESVDAHAMQQAESRSSQQVLNSGLSQAQTEPAGAGEAEATPQVDARVAESGQAANSAQFDAEKGQAAVDAHPQTDEDVAAELLTQDQIEQGQIEQGTIEKGVVDRGNGLGQASVAESPVIASQVAENGAVQVNTSKANAASSVTEQPFVSPEIEEQLDNVDKQGRVIDETRKAEAIKADWVLARKSFYQRNYPLSEQSYQKVIENSQDNFDAYGELGNVYFNQGKNQQAASAYFEAAAILVRTGQVNRARSLMGLLRHLDKSKASELQQLINSTLSS